MKLKFKGIYDCKNCFILPHQPFLKAAYDSSFGWSENVVSGLHKQQEHTNRGLSNFKRRICVTKSNNMIRQTKF